MNDTTKRLYEAAKSGSSVKGKKELIAHFEGQKLSPRQAIRAKCYDCQGYYVDGRGDCKDHDCPMYSYSPYTSNPHQSRQRQTQETKDRAASRMRELQLRKKIEKQQEVNDAF